MRVTFKETYQENRPLFWVLILVFLCWSICIEILGKMPPPVFENKKKDLPLVSIYKNNPENQDSFFNPWLFYDSYNSSGNS